MTRLSQSAETGTYVIDEAHQTSPLPHFASDNVAGVCPEIMDALSKTASKWALPYGGDTSTQALADWARTECGDDAEIYPVFNGTGANVIALQAATQRWGAVICTPEAHINNDEGSAPERLAGLKLLHRPSVDGKLRPSDIETLRADPSFVHGAQPGVVSVTQSTELGTLYSLDELRELSAAAHHHNLAFHIDGARMSNAAYALGCGIGEVTAGVGADIVSLGGTKNGAMAAEAVVVINPQRVAGIEYIRKYSMQLASKQSFISAQLLRLFGTGLWRKNAAHAHTQAVALAHGLAEIPGVRLSRDVVVNAVFPEVSHELMEIIQSQYMVHQWDTADNGRPVLRFMCSWQTSTTDIENLLSCMRSGASTEEKIGAPESLTY